jgi:hypothetical protein
MEAPLLIANNISYQQETQIARKSRERRRPVGPSPEENWPASFASLALGVLWMSGLGKESKMGILPPEVLQSDESTLGETKIPKDNRNRNCGRHDGKNHAIFERRLSSRIFDCR